MAPIAAELKKPLIEGSHCLIADKGSAALAIMFNSLCNIVI